MNMDSTIAGSMNACSSLDC